MASPHFFPSTGLFDYLFRSGAFQTTATEYWKYELTIGNDCPASTLPRHEKPTPIPFPGAPSSSRSRRRASKPLQRKVQVLIHVIVTIGKPLVMTVISSTVI